MSLEVLNFSLVLLRRRAGPKRAEVSAFARPSILLPRIEPVLARFELSDHGLFLSALVC